MLDAEWHLPIHGCRFSRSLLQHPRRPRSQVDTGSRRAAQGTAIFRQGSKSDMVHIKLLQWVSYDDEETVRLKQEYANSRCLGGSMVWAMDQVNRHSACELAPARTSTVSTAFTRIVSNDSTAPCLGQTLSSSISQTRRALTSLGRALFSRQNNSTAACSSLSQKYGVPTSTLKALSGGLACSFTVPASALQAPSSKHDLHRLCRKPAKRHRGSILGVESCTR